MVKLILKGWLFLWCHRCVAYVRLSNQFAARYVSLSALCCLVQKGLAVRGLPPGGLSLLMWLVDCQKRLPYLVS